MQALTYDVRKARVIEEDDIYQNGAAILIQAAIRGKLARRRAQATHGEQYSRKLVSLYQIRLPSESITRSAHKIDSQTLVVPYKSKHKSPRPAWEQAFEVGVTPGTNDDEQCISIMKLDSNLDPTGSVQSLTNSTSMGYVFACYTYIEHAHHH